MKEGVYPLEDVPRLSRGLPAIKNVGWQLRHRCYHRGQVFRDLYICFTLNTEPGTNQHIANGQEVSRSAFAPRLGFVLPGTSIRTVSVMRHDELFFSYSAESLPFWRQYSNLQSTNFCRTAGFEFLLNRVFECLDDLYTPGQADVLDCLVLQLLAEIRVGKQLEEESREEKIIRDIASHLTSDLTSPPDIQHLLRSNGMSRRTFYRWWNRIYTSSPGEMLLARRMLTAEHLLLTSDMQIQEISAACGFNTSAYFYQSFRRYHGCSPAEFRRKFRDDPDPS